MASDGERFESRNGTSCEIDTARCGDANMRRSVLLIAHSACRLNVPFSSTPVLQGFGLKCTVVATLTMAANGRNGHISLMRAFVSQ